MADLSCRNIDKTCGILQARALSTRYPLGVTLALVLAPESRAHLVDAPMELLHVRAFAIEH